MKWQMAGLDTGSFNPLISSVRGSLLRYALGLRAQGKGGAEHGVSIHAASAEAILAILHAEGGRIRDVVRPMHQHIRLVALRTISDGCVCIRPTYDALVRLAFSDLGEAVVAPMRLASDDELVLEDAIFDFCHDYTAVLHGATSAGPF